MIYPVDSVIQPLNNRGVVFRFSRAVQFSVFIIDVDKNTSCVIHLHRVALSRPTAPIQCKFSVIMFVTVSGQEGVAFGSYNRPPATPTFAPAQTFCTSCKAWFKHHARALELILTPISCETQIHRHINKVFTLHLHKLRYQVLD